MVSWPIDVRSASSNAEKIVGSGATVASVWSSYCDAKLSTRAFARGSFSMRRTCMSKVAGCESFLVSAYSKSTSSGIELQRK